MVKKVQKSKSSDVIEVKGDSFVINRDNDSDQTDHEQSDDFEPEEVWDGETLPDVVLPDSKELTLYQSQVSKTDPLTAYLRQIARYELLSIEQEKALLQALEETGDIDIAKKLVVANLRLVVKIAMEYRTAWQNVMDLIQEGNIGLMKAVSKYDSSKGAKLSYYASWWIRSYILKHILDNFRLVKIGSGNEQKKLFFNLMKEKQRLLGMGINPDVKTISENLGVSEKAVITMGQRLEQGGEISLDKPAGPDNDTPLSAVLPGLSEPSFEDDVADAQGVDLLRAHLQDFLKDLKPRDQDIFKRRLLEEVPPSLQDIADEYGVSRERIRQIEERLLKNLKVYMSEFIR